ncbi:CapA family protein [Phenylobacterium sp.]|uniref:CapA family protein n=1 Tax=Phenylobacterium sp. TaxID=1871053 RepID=UPI0025FF471F|nr:CapA family protein [Phenylobacterium sp.]
MRGRRAVPALAAALLLGAAETAWAQPAGVARPPSDPAALLAAPPRPAGVRGRFRVVSVGDVMLARPQAATDDPELRKVLDAIRAADVAIGNQEGPALDLKALPRGTFGMFGGLIGEPGMAADYKAMGFDLMSVANNHSTDWGGVGLLAALKLLDDAGVAYAGGGVSMAEARRAGFAETPKGRVGLVATASTFKANARAGDAGPLAPDQSGISTLRTRTLNLVTPGQFAMLRRLATELASPLKPAPAADAREVRFDDQIYRVADRDGLSYQMDQIDHAALLKAVRDGKSAADLLVFHIHAHETPTGVDDDTPEPPDFLVKLFHDAVDAGADVVMGGGPHSLRGVEIYHGKPIFYGLGLFFFKPQLMGAAESGPRKWPDDGYPPPPDPRPGNPRAWYDSVLAVSEFDGARLKQVRLYPIDLANAQPARGLPHFATGARAAEILARLQSDSAPLGTKIAIEDGVGVIEVR